MSMDTVYATQVIVNTVAFAGWKKKRNRHRISLFAHGRLEPHVMYEIAHHGEGRHIAAMEVASVSMAVALPTASATKIKVLSKPTLPVSMPRNASSQVTKGISRQLCA